VVALRMVPILLIIICAHIACFPDDLLAIGIYRDAPFAIPTSGIVTSLFEQSGSDVHLGVDISSHGGKVRGAPVYAAYPGKVIFVGKFGKSIDGDDAPARHTVAIDHGLVNGKYTVTIYMHMGLDSSDNHGVPISFVDKCINPDTVVRMGTYLGDQGAAGNATGTHLHFEVRQRDIPWIRSSGWYSGGIPVDPSTYLVGSASLKKNESTLSFNGPSNDRCSAEAITPRNYYLFRNESYFFVTNVGSDRLPSTWRTRWPGSDVSMALTTPSGETINPVDAQGVHRMKSGTAEVIQVDRPEIGAWGVEVQALDVAPEGELVNVTVSSTQPPPGCSAATPLGRYCARYYQGIEAQGSVAGEEEEAGVSIDHQWGIPANPGHGVGPNNFSVTWSGTFDFAGGDYTFTVGADDAFELFVDDISIYNAWFPAQGLTAYPTIPLAAGTHSVKLRYFQLDGGAWVRLHWDRTGCPAGQYFARYYQGTDTIGTPTASRCEASTLDGGLDTSSSWGFPPNPGVGVGPNGFSAVWTRKVNFTQGVYTFTVQADDGFELIIDGTPVKTAWFDTGAAVYSVPVALSAGQHVVTLRYLQQVGGGWIKLRWLHTGCPTGQYFVQYFNNRDTAGEPADRTCETEPQIDHEWGNPANPGHGLGSTNFSAQWEGTFDFAGGDYDVTVKADDGFQLWVDDDSKYTAWFDYGNHPIVVPVTLTPGRHVVKLRYFQQFGGASVHLRWDAVQRPPNDSFSSATPIGLSGSPPGGAANAITTAATTEAGEPRPSCLATGASFDHTVWYQCGTSSLPRRLALSPSRRLAAATIRSWPCSRARQSQGSTKRPATTGGSVAPA
jgi:hypothetical protein